MKMDLDRMAPLSPAAVRYIVVHTADFDGRNCDVEMINQWHVDPPPRGNGWAGIGYHFVIVNDRHEAIPDGTVQIGRPVDRQGSHVEGIDHMSVGICCVGKGDRTPFTARQMDSLLPLVAHLMERFKVPVERVIGHREVNRLVDQGVLPEKDSKGKTNRTEKTCPGLKVDMEALRARIRHYVEVEGLVAPTPEVVPAPRPAPEPVLKTIVPPSPPA